MLDLLQLRNLAEKWRRRQGWVRSLADIGREGAGLPGV